MTWQELMKNIKDLVKAGAVGKDYTIARLLQDCFLDYYLEQNQRLLERFDFDKCFGDSLFMYSLPIVGTPADSFVAWSWQILEHYPETSDFFTEADKVLDLWRQRYGKASGSTR